MSNTKFNAKIYPWYVEFCDSGFYVIDDSRAFNRSRIIAGPFNRDVAELIRYAPQMKQENEQLRSHIQWLLDNSGIANEMADAPKNLFEPLKALGFDLKEYE